MSVIGQPKPLASLSSTLLARKGQARPAMRPQGFGGFGTIPGGQDDLGWNDMGHPDDLQPEFHAPDQVFAPPAGVPPVLRQREALHEEFEAPRGPETHEPADYAPQGYAHEAYEPEDDEPEMGGPETDGPETHEPETDQPQAYHTEAYQPETYQPEAYRPEIYRPEAYQPEAYQPEADAPPAYQPEAHQPEAYQQGPYESGAYEPEAYAPEAEEPEVDGPEAYQPARHMPELYAPEPAPVREPAFEPRPMPVAHVAPTATVSLAAAAQIGRETEAKMGKAAFTLRLDHDRHLRLRLASALHNLSAQALVTEALDSFLKSLPEVEELASQLPPPRAKN